MASFCEEIQLGVKNDRNEELKEIIRNCCRKDKKSQEMLYKQFFGYALSIALIYTKQRENAIEIVNDSFLKVFSDISSFDSSKPFKAWFRKIVVNTAIDKFRRERKNVFFDEKDSLHIADHQTNIISDLTADDLMNLMNQLPDIQKIIFILYEIEGFSHEEISQKLHIPASSSRVYLTRAKKKLRDLFQLYFNIHHERLGNR
ncbi:RNA polymerase sigma factor [Maribellus maritimus]|uniref:RNA polymerase sigma factor n=1 Tax=Maribellus maritimus TaxID=2870838 RepID=UPI001EEB34DE|nr:RNA polymerase sigma factor [Maribellus maritimus]MCG6191189.1 RNA polymerase sigma factor [Maribellus maritimus]